MADFGLGEKMVVGIFSEILVIFCLVYQEGGVALFVE